MVSFVHNEFYFLEAYHLESTLSTVTKFLHIFTDILFRSIGMMDDKSALTNMVKVKLGVIRDCHSDSHYWDFYPFILTPLLLYRLQY